MTTQPSRPPADDPSFSPTVCAFEVELQVQKGASAGERHVLTRFPVFVGRGNDADVRLAADADDRMLSRRHLKISVEGGRIVITDLSTNGTWVGQRHLPPNEPVVLSGGEPVWLGPKTMIELRHLGAPLAPPETRAVPAGPGPHETAAPSRGREPLPGEGGVPLQIDVLGQVRVLVGEIEVKVWAARKAMVLLACLADGPPGRTVSAERLIDLLWPDAEGDNKGALQATVSRIRRAFRTEDPQLPDPVDLYRGGYRLSPSYALRFDARLFEALCEEATQGGGRRAEPLEQAIALYQGPFLDGYTDDWAQARRRTLETLFFDALDSLGEVREEQEAWAAAIRAFETALEREPCRERSQLGLMRSLAASGRRDEAIRRYHDFVRLLKKEMGLTPGPDLVRMHENLITWP
jgi:DNA-binding SARP family transcriptional activator